MDFEIAPASRRFDPHDDRWLAQVRQLTSDLRREVGGVGQRSDPVPGTKGDVGTIILALGSAGAFTAAVEMIKLFVARDQGRSVSLSWHQDGRLQSFEISGGGIDGDEVERVVRLLDRGERSP